MHGGRGMVEQDQMPDFLADVLELRHHEVAGDIAQRQIIDFEIPVDVGVDAGCEVFQRLAQIAEKPITVATDDAISNLADSRQRLLATSFRRPNSIVRSQPP